MSDNTNFWTSLEAIYQLILGFNEYVTGSVAYRQVHSLPSFELNEGRMKALCRKPMQEQPIAGLKRRERNQGMLVVHQADVRRISDQLLRVNLDRLVEL